MSFVVIMGDLVGIVAINVSCNCGHVSFYQTLCVYVLFYSQILSSLVIYENLFPCCLS